MTEVTIKTASREPLEEVDIELLSETLEYIRPALQADGGDLVLLRRGRRREPANGRRVRWMSDVDDDPQSRN